MSRRRPQPRCVVADELQLLCVGLAGHRPVVFERLPLPDLARGLRLPTLEFRRRRPEDAYPGVHIALEAQAGGGYPVLAGLGEVHHLPPPPQRGHRRWPRRQVLRPEAY